MSVCCYCDSSNAELTRHLHIICKAIYQARHLKIIQTSQFGVFYDVLYKITIYVYFHVLKYTGIGLVYKI